ncbi:MAG: DHA2 family efflux MFS transporter permease subunit [Candidatus Tectomicrobia bacterium]|nr:DHA2 family efflux MFS transporter permease subunit [Candidatus Tectomicrobia bacterium]
MAQPTTSPAQSRPVLQVDMEAPYYKWLVAGTVLLAGATQTFAGNSVNLAIPRIMAAFGTDLATTQWVTTSFLIARTLMVPILGWLGGFLGNRNLFICVMSGFLIGSIGCGLAVNIPMLVFFRLIQGLALGPMEGLSVVLLINAFPTHQRGLAIGMRTIGWSAGQIVSFTIGGYFIEELSWRMIFFLGLPSGAIAAFLGFLLLPQEREYRGVPVDYAGLIALTVFLVPLLLAISFARRDDTEISTLVILAGLSLVGSILFVVRELFAQHPAVNLRLFRVSGFRLLCGTAFLNTLGLFGAQFMIPIFLQQVMGFTPLQAGLTIVPALIISAFGGTISGQLSDWFSPRLLILIALLALGIVFRLFSTVAATTTVGILVSYIIFYRVCLFSINTPLTALNVRILDDDQVRMGQGLMGMVRNIAAGLGVTVSSVLFERRRTHHQLLSYSNYGVTSPEHSEVVEEIGLSLRSAGVDESLVGPMTLSALRQQMNLEAISSGFRDTFFSIGFCFLVAMLPMLFISRRYTRKS